MAPRNIITLSLWGRMKTALPVMLISVDFYTEAVGFKGNVDGCNPAYSFHYMGCSDSLFVFETPVDMAPLMRLMWESSISLPNTWTGRLKKIVKRNAKASDQRT